MQNLSPLFHAHTISSSFTDVLSLFQLIMMFDYRSFTLNIYNIHVKSCIMLRTEFIRNQFRWFVRNEIWETVIQITKLLRVILQKYIEKMNNVNEAVLNRFKKLKTNLFLAEI